MTRLQSFIVALTLMVCLGVGLWASQRALPSKTVRASEPAPLSPIPPDPVQQSEIIPATASEPALSPRKLTADDAAPATNHPVRRAIDRLMPTATDEERRIWFDELRELPVSAVEDLLRLRTESNLTAPTLSTPRPMPPIEGNVDGTAAARPLAQERRMILHNLLNADTHGFRAIQSQRLPVPFAIGDSSGDGHPDPVHWQGYRIDTRPGELEATERPLDIAIRGAGWLIVEDADGQPAFTRHGALRMNEQRELEAPAIPDGRPLSPKITIPENTAHLFIDGNGQVYAGTEFGKWNTEQPLGQIRLARFFDDSALVLHKDGLYHPTPAAGTMTRCVPGEQAGVIEAGALEKSNVDREAQEAALHRIEIWIKRHTPQMP